MPDSRDPVKALRDAMEDSEEHLRALPGRDDSIADVTISLLDARALLARLDALVVAGDDSAEWLAWNAPSNDTSHSAIRARAVVEHWRATKERVR